MKKKEVIKLLGIIAAAYPNMKEVDEATVALWYECLKDVDVKPALVAVKKHILESIYPPSIADIRKQITEITMPKEQKIDGATAWGEVVSAIKNYGIYREEEALASMSPLTQRVVKYMSWQEICLSDNPGVVRGQFLKMYETIAEQEKRDMLLPDSFKQEMKQIAKNSNPITGLIESMDMNKRLDSKN